MLKSISILVILAITISFSIQYADATHESIPIPEAPDNLRVHGVGNETVTLRWDNPDTSAQTDREKIDKFFISAVSSDGVRIGYDNSLETFLPRGTQEYVEYRMNNLDNTLDYTFTVRSVATNVSGLGTNVDTYAELTPGLLEKYGRTVTLERAAQDVTVEFKAVESVQNENGKKISENESITAYVKWTPPNNPNVNNDRTGYDVEYRQVSHNESGNISTTLKSADIENTKFEFIARINNLNFETNYEFVVTAKQGLGTNNDVPVTLYERTPEKLPTTVLNYDLGEDLKKVSNHDSITLSWSKPTLECSVTVTQDGEHVRHAYLGSNKEYTIDHLRSNTEYTFDITCDGISTTTTATTQDPIVPNAPTLNNNSTNYSNGIKISWSDAKKTFATTITDDGGADITDYIIEYSSDGDTWTTFNDGTSNKRTAFVTGLADGEYKFRVSAVNSAGQGEPSDEKMYTVDRDADDRYDIPTSPVTTPTETPTDPAVPPTSPKTDDTIETITEEENNTEVGMVTVRIDLFRDTSSDTNNNNHIPNYDRGDGVYQEETIKREFEVPNNIRPTTVIYQPSTNTFLSNDYSRGTVWMEDLPVAPFYVITIPQGTTTLTTPSYTDERGVEHKGVTYIDEIFSNGETRNVSTSGLAFNEFRNASVPGQELKPGITIEIAIGILP